jgi:hypothetical protein
MSKRFEDLREKLLMAGVAPRHVRRYLAELKDHLDDLRGETGSEEAALARLGSLEDLAKPILARPELRSLTARYPSAILGIGPIALWLGAVVGSVCLLIVLTPVLRERGLMPHHGPNSTYVYAVIHGVMLVSLRIMPVALAMAALISAIRQRSSLLRPGIGAALVLIASFTLTFNITLSTTPGQSEMGLTSWMLPFLMPFTDAVGPMDARTLAPGLIRAAAIFAAIMGASLLWRRVTWRAA